MKRKKTHALAAGILPLITMVPLETSADALPSTLGAHSDSPMTSKTSGKIAGFPVLPISGVLAVNTAKPPPPPPPKTVAPPPPPPPKTAKPPPPPPKTCKVTAKHPTCS